jgi:hypothetical protein
MAKISKSDWEILMYKVKNEGLSVAHAAEEYGEGERRFKDHLS